MECGNQQIINTILFQNKHKNSILLLLWPTSLSFNIYTPSPTSSPNASDDEGEDGMQDGSTEEDVEGKAQWEVVE